MSTSFNASPVLAGDRLRKKDLVATLSLLRTLARDIARMHDLSQHGYRLQTIAFDQGGITVPAGPRVRSTSLSAHTALEIEEMLTTGSVPPFEALAAPFAWIPPLCTSDTLSVQASSSPRGLMSGQAIDMTVAFGGVTFTSKSLDVLAGDLLPFLRIHSHLSMGPTLTAWLLRPTTPRITTSVWADTGESALLRFAAAAPEVRKALAAGEAYACVPDTSRGRTPSVPDSVREILNKRGFGAVDPERTYTLCPNA
mgnify:CR=1 FL=1